MGPVTISSTQQRITAPYTRIIFPRQFFVASTANSFGIAATGDGTETETGAESPVEKMVQRAISKVTPEPRQRGQKQTSKADTELLRRLSEPLKKATTVEPLLKEAIVEPLEAIGVEPAKKELIELANPTFDKFYINNVNELVLVPTSPIPPPTLEHKTNYNTFGHIFRPSNHSTIDWETWRTFIPNSVFSAYNNIGHKQMKPGNKNGNGNGNDKQEEMARLRRFIKLQQDHMQELKQENEKYRKQIETMLQDNFNEQLKHLDGMLPKE